MSCVRNDERALIAHLLRRAGFGPAPGQLDRLAARGYNGAVDSIVNGGPDSAAEAVALPAITVVNTDEVETIEERKARAKERREQRLAITNWWLQRMSVAEQPLVEKMTFYWHGHFATSVDKVRESSLMLSQNQTMRVHALGKFETLAQAIAKDPAMMIWLDANQNRKGSPNENFARELMELFTIGIGTYSENDVKEAARAFTGWRTNRRTGMYSFAAGQADRAPKTFLGRTLTTGEEAISFLANHPAAAKFVSAKLWFKFASPITVDSPIVAELANVFSNSGGDIRAVMRAIFLHPQFTSDGVRQGLIKQPVEYVVGALRASGLTAANTDVVGPNLFNVLGNLNQVPFDPPSVGGWPGNGYWISTSTAQGRLNFANALAGQAKLDWLSGASSPTRPDVIADRLGVDGWTASTRSALVSASNPRQQFALALVSPEYVLN